MSGSIWRFLVAVVVSLFFLTGLVEIPLVVGSAGDLGGPYLALSHGALCGSCFVDLVSCVSSRTSLCSCVSDPILCPLHYIYPGLCVEQESWLDHHFQ